MTICLGVEGVAEVFRLPFLNGPVGELHHGRPISGYGEVGRMEVRFAAAEALGGFGEEARVGLDAEGDGCLGGFFGDCIMRVLLAIVGFSVAGCGFLGC